MSKRLVSVEEVPNENAKTFHLGYEISQSRIENFIRPLRSSSETYLKKIGPLGEKIIKALFSIDGITEVFIKPYELSVHKAELFSWTVIEPQVLDILLDREVEVPRKEEEMSLWNHFKREVKSLLESQIKKIKKLFLSISNWKIFHPKSN